MPTIKYYDTITGEWVVLAAGKQGLTGATGPQGPPGSTGSSGPSGGLGATGATGPQGTSGPSGPIGATGSQGATGVGLTGATGAQGATGVAGDSGIQGFTGPQGPSGVQGATGVAGSSGVAGATGIQGATGPQGASGIVGATGLQGPQGFTGPSGVPGAAGIQGFTGPAGPSGVQGATGPAGATGSIGATGPAGTGDVVGPASATSNALAVYNGTTGKLIQNSTTLISDVVTLNESQTLVSKSLTSPTLTGTINVPTNIVANTFTVAFPDASTTIVGRSTVDTMTNKRITPRVGTTASGSTITPVGDDNDLYTVTALAANATIAAPSGTPTNGQKLMLRIKDNATARTLTWNAIYRAIGVTLPTITVISKTTYIGLIYNSTDTKWDVIAVGTEA